MKTKELTLMQKELFPEHATEALEKWDSGISVFTVELGGLGPGYEQAIQILVFEIIRDYIDRPLPTPDNWRSFGEDAVSRCNSSCLGFSGAQVGAAKNLAFHALRDGWRATIFSFPDDRQIQVSKAFPQPPEKTGVPKSL
jgi:hypothetical protein